MLSSLACSVCFWVSILNSSSCKWKERGKRWNCVLGGTQISTSVAESNWEKSRFFSLSRFSHLTIFQIQSSREKKKSGQPIRLTRDLFNILNLHFSSSSSSSSLTHWRFKFRSRIFFFFFKAKHDGSSIFVHDVRNWRRGKGCYRIEKWKIEARGREFGCFIVKCSICVTSRWWR